MFKDKVLLITGGTGSFGNAVLKKLIREEFAEIRIFSRDEKKQDDMRRRIADDRVSFHVGDVRDLSSLQSVMRGVNYVFHAAALKQVPSCEFFPMEAVRTNVFGTDNMLTAAIAAGVEKVICLSTDKAAYPINAMGTSKAMMEKVFVARSREAVRSGTTVCGTRYGNVMASRGSVIPLFIEQIQSPDPITVTDGTMTRFLMNLDEAVELVLYAFQNASAGDILIQKSPASTIADLADALCQLFEVEKEIVTIGIRHGEKRYETLMTSEEGAKCEDLGDYFRIPIDSRGLNYGKYFTDGISTEISSFQEYNSQVTNQLSIDEIISKLQTVDYVRTQLAEWRA